jgi:hypothetical protein
MFVGLSPLIADPNPAPMDAPIGPPIANPIAPVTAGRIFFNIYRPYFLGVTAPVNNLGAMTLTSRRISSVVVSVLGSAISLLA